MGPKKMLPPQPGEMWFEQSGNQIRLQNCPTEEEYIRHDTTRDKVISSMNRIHRDHIDPKTFLQDKEENDLMVMVYPEAHSVYDEGMKVELKMENLVSIETLVQNVGQVLTGKFLLCRTITPSSKMVGVDAGVEDVEGKKAMRLALFNYSMEAQMGKSDFEAVLPLGTMLIVKNPVFKKPYFNSSDFGLLVENPADVELLSPKRMEALFPGVQWKSDLPKESRELLKSPLVWEFSPDQSDLEISTKMKNVGNKAFLDNRSTDAVRFYDLALEYLPGMEITPAVSTLLLDILCNKAAALIKLGCFNPALVCTSKVLMVNNAHVKAIYRHAKALFGLGRYDDGEEFLDEKLHQYPSLGKENKDILRLRSLIPELLKPPGEEIIRALRSPRPNGSYEPQPDLPVGMMDRISEFRGPIRLGKSRIGKGEGLLATQDLEPGTILLICKPFAALYCSSEEARKFSLNTSTHEYIVGVMANKLWLDPLLGRDLYKLWAGPELGTLTDNAEDAQAMTKVDIARIEHICKLNVSGVSFDKESRGKTFISCGVWIPSSKINHSCIDANVMQGQHDSSLVMMVTTFKHVKKGEEILASYVDPMLPLSERDFMKRQGFICTCRLCEVDRSESALVVAKREELLKSLAYDPVTSSYGFHPLILGRDLGRIAQIESLRAATPELNFGITHAGIFTIAAIVLLDEGLYPECLSILTKIYAVMRNIPPFHVHIDLVAAILVCCMRIGRKRAVLKKWTKKLGEYCRLYAGTLEYVRVGIHPTIPEDLKEFGIEFFTDN